MNSMIYGLDLAKNIFHLVDSKGKRTKLTRKKLTTYFANIPASVIALEACSGAHYWARIFIKQGHQVKLLPPQHVKAYLRGQKNDFNDARAILEAAEHGKIRHVPPKTIDQQDRQALLRTRGLLVAERTRLVNQIRALLYEYGITMPQGMSSAQKQIPLILEDAENELSVLTRELLFGLYSRLQRFNTDIELLNEKVKALVKEDEDCKRLQDIPGFGPLVSYAFKSWLGNGQQFKCGRDASAAIGLVPKQRSSGDKPVLLGISKRGDAYLRSLLIHGARAVAIHVKPKDDKLSLWVKNLIDKRGFNKAIVALANKLVRIAWVIVARNETYKMS